MSGGSDGNPQSQPETINVTDENGDPLTLYYYHLYTTNSSGWVKIENQMMAQNHKYALVEVNTPAGNQAPDGPIVFRFNPEGLDAIDVIVDVRATKTVVNYPFTYRLPETGGIGTGIPVASGIVLVCGAAFILLCRRSRKSEE